MKKNQNLFVIAIMLILVGCAAQQASHNISTGNITDEEVRKLLNDFSEITKNDNALVKKVNSTKGVDKMSAMGNFLGLMKNKNALKTSIFNDMITIVKSSNDTSKRLNTWIAIGEILKFIDLEKLKLLKGDSEQQVAYSIAGIYERMLLSASNPKDALGYLNYTYDNLKSLLLELEGKEDAPEVKQIASSIETKFNQ